MKRFLPLFILIALGSCAPMPYYFNVDIRNQSELDYNINGKKVALFSVMPKGDKDSISATAIAIGAAKKIEEDNGYTKGTIPVYSLFSEETDLSSYASIFKIAQGTSSDVLLFVKDLKLSSFSVESPSLTGQLVILPFDAKYYIFDKNKIKAIYNSEPTDSLIWSIISDAPVGVSLAINKAKTTLNKMFIDVGAEFASQVSTQWIPQERMLVLFDSSKWMKARDLAMDFKWEEAMDIWMAEVKSSDVRKSAAAAYNIALACDILGDYDIADKWLDYARDKYYFGEIDDLAKVIQLSRRRAEQISKK